MAANVECVGGGAVQDPCGWKGERFPSVPITSMTRIAAADFKRKATAKPCPRCGGRVELISQEPGGGT